MVKTEPDPVEVFKDRTVAKLRDVRCPVHRQPPRVHFSGGSLREMTISLSGCCSTLIHMANKAIGTPGKP